MKKKLLFVIDSLNCAGAEKSLTTLLNIIDYSRYDVDLQLFAYEGEFLELVPKEVKLLKSFSYTEYCDYNLGNAIKIAIKERRINELKSRIRYSYLIRKKRYNNKEKARLYWQCNSKVIECNPKVYDVAIAYAQGVPTFYVMDKVNAIKKVAWVNVSYQLIGSELDFQKKYYYKYNDIVAVSETTKSIFLENYPKLKDKMTVIIDINDDNFIKKMSLQGTSYNDNFEGLRILTIGRLANQKGYDIAVEACRLLKENGITFKWYVLGKGSMEIEIRNWIKEKHIEDNFILLGVKPNPYPYIKDCNIYVQTSKFEGFGIAIAEARMLNKPVVTTRFDAVYSQMKDEKNGLVVDMNGQAVCDGIIRLLSDSKLRNSIIDYLKHEKKGNKEEIKKIYELLES